MASTVLVSGKYTKEMSFYNMFKVQDQKNLRRMDDLSLTGTLEKKLQYVNMYCILQAFL